MFKVNVILLRQCRSIRSLHTAINNCKTLDTLILNNNSHTRFTRVLPVSSFIRFSSSNTENISGSQNVPSDAPSDIPVTPEGLSNNPTVIDASTNSGGIDYILPPPPPPESLLEVPLTALGEPTLASYGLGTSWWPVSWVLNALEYMHVTTGMPWWATIGAAVAVIRILIFPIVIKQQRVAAEMSVHMPYIQNLQAEATKERTSGNYYEASKKFIELEKYVRTNNCNPLRSFLLPAVQAPIYMSFFLGLRKCANLPVESFQTGGMLWFQDLTVLDPYYLLPLGACGTIFLIMKMGTEMPNLDAMKFARVIMYVVPVVTFPFFMNWPAGVTYYLLCSNLVSLAQVSFIRYPGIREKLNIPQMQKPKAAKKDPMDKRSMIRKMKEEYVSQKIAREVMNRAQYDDIKFKNSARGPIKKTYSSNPLEFKPRSQS